MSKITAAITAVGGFVPEDKLTNFDLEKMVDTNDEWIRTRTGVSERRILKGEGKGSSDLGAPAVLELCKKRGTYIGHALYCEFENCLAFLVNVMFFCCDGFIAWRPDGASCFHVQVRSAGTITAQDAIQYTVSFIIRFEQYCGAGITK